MRLLLQHFSIKLAEGREAVEVGWEKRFCGRREKVVEGWAKSCAVGEEKQLLTRR